ncbi:NAD-dependent epimerase/dehydratase family protein [Cytobacillus firmus]|uniref:NAD-dependent epimerase/dehydratase family protein n=1 Tax=Cytobacillus firmus TaxID=1399 RepID=UPI0021C9ADCD|nr:NAD-dependent epimerase/dehydratase family protein [Cytobacillus firmus]MCU1803815.1 NAD-dependent epimerase/dehydratase family protein [Cytobacillus firmus]WHY36518.1 NAD-dependent epimerase/dehydratase family protein [Cytobacillus firmus]
MKKNIYEAKRALVTGATGFIGSHLSKRLVKDGWIVHVLVREHSNISPLKNSGDSINFHYYNGSMATMTEILKTAKPDVVFHLASMFIAQHTSAQIDSLIQSNITFGVQLAEAMVLNGIYCLINTGTSWQHFEDKDYSPVCLYAATKQAFESLLTYYSESSKLKVINLKLFDSYGPEDYRPKLFSLLRKASFDNSPLIMSPGEQLIDLVYIDDIVDAFLKAASRIEGNDEIRWEDFAVTSRSPISLKEVVNTYQAVTGKKLSIKWGALPYRKNEVMLPWSKGKLIPGWKPQVSLIEGIKKMEEVQRAENLEK